MKDFVFFSFIILNRNVKNIPRYNSAELIIASAYALGSPTCHVATHSAFNSTLPFVDMSYTILFLSSFQLVFWSLFTSNRLRTNFFTSSKCTMTSLEKGYCYILIIKMRFIFFFLTTINYGLFIIILWQYEVTFTKQVNTVSFACGLSIIS